MAVEKDLYDALMAKNFEKVSRLCRSHPGYALQKITIYKDTPLHMAAQCRQGKDLLLELLKMLPAEYNSQLSGSKNEDGNTVLHEVAASDAMEDAAKELLLRDPNLITQGNELREKPIFCAARYGQIGMFEFLADKMELETLTPEERKAHLQRNDRTTVLHVSIRTECFKLSKSIAERYPFLINEKDESSMTALQYLSCNLTAFQKGKAQIKQGFTAYLINKSKAYTIPTSLLQEFLQDLAESNDEIFNKELMERERCLQELVHHLVKNDTSWNTDSKVVGSNDSKEANMEAKKEAEYPQESLKSDESPLFLATMSNIKVIVEEILKFKPDALRHTNEDGMNMLHVAILYRRTDIFDMVIEKFEVLARRLLLAKDNKGNSVLHMVSLKSKSVASEKMQSPALQLRNELQLFEKVKAASKMVVTNPLNKDKKTAEELFTATNEQLHKEAKELLMRTAEHCTILSVFIATVAFAAAYTVPGGPDQDNGYPMFRSKPFFAIFILADMTSITSGLISLVIFLSVLTSQFFLQDFQGFILARLARGFIYLILSVSAMVVAFGATIVLMMARNREKVVWDAVAFLPVFIFFLSNSPLRSVNLERCLKWTQILTDLCVFLILFIPHLIFTLFIALPYGIFVGLHCAGDFIRKHVLICKSAGNQSQLTISNAPSPNATSDSSFRQV